MVEIPPNDDPSDCYPHSMLENAYNIILADVSDLCRWREWWQLSIPIFNHSLIYYGCVGTGRPILIFWPIIVKRADLIGQKIN